MTISNDAPSAGHKPALTKSSTLSHSERWYAVHTLPFAEARAERQLQRQEFRTFQPKRYKTVRHARKLSTMEAAFFPRYLFIVLDFDRHQWRSVNGTIGVSRLVMRGDEPHPVPHGVVEALIESADERGILQLGRKLQLGEPVRLVAGPFAEQLATLHRLDDAGRVQVLLHILGRQVAISTEENNILPLL
jgi:transcription elongation factor/antiterminator RfaH